jgi:glycosyltransferase involved in cell wall biosynthesis
MPPPLVSVLVPVYNSERMVAKCIDSVLSQTLEDFELVIVDDCSTDRTWEILQSYQDPRIKLHRNPQNLGLMPNFNRASSFGVGHYFKFLCADDALDPTALEEAVAVMEGDPEIGLVKFHARKFEALEQPLGREMMLLHGVYAGETIIMLSVLLMTNSFCNTPSHTLIRREDFLAAGGFPNVMDFDGWGNDFFLNMKIILGKKVHLMDRFLLRRGIGSHQATDGLYKSRRKFFGSIVYFRKRLLDDGIISPLLFAVSSVIGRLTNELLFLKGNWERRSLS